MEQQLGKYTVIRRLGVGGMAEVFLCRLVGIGGFEKHVVVKKIRADIATDEEFITMFFDEARLAANLSHPNIIQTFEVDQLDGTPYIAMEYVRGATVSSVLQKLRAAQTTMPFGHLAYIFAGVCGGLDHAHNARDASGRALNIVHRDVSPQNIIVSLDGTPKIFDFGVAKARGSLSLTGADRVKGKFSYMAPEQLRALPVDAKADVYAVGVCMYEAVTGRRPFSGTTEPELFAARLKGEFRMPSELAPSIPVELEHLILSAMASDPADRPSAAELQDSLAAFCAVGSAHPVNTTTMVTWLREIVGEQAEAYETYSSNPSLVSLPRGTNLAATTPAVEGQHRRAMRINPLIAVLGLAAIVLGATLVMILVRKQRTEFGPATVANAPAPQPAQPPAAAAGQYDDAIRSLVDRAQQSLDAQQYDIAADALAKAAALDTTNTELVMKRSNLQHRLELAQVKDELAAKRVETAAAAAAAPPAYTIEERRPERVPDRPERSAAKKKPTPARIVVAAKGSGSPTHSHGSAGSAGSAWAGGSGSQSGSSGSATAGSGGSGSAQIAAQVPSAPRVAAPAPVAPAPAQKITATPAPSIAIANPGTFDAVPSFSKLSVDGSLTATEVQSALARTTDTLRTCYRAAAKRANQTPEVSIRVSFEIDEGARASGVRISGDAIGLGTCAKEALGDVRTRVAPDVGTVSVSAVVRFKPTR
jgi:serine/threonine protein kinase